MLRVDSLYTSFNGQQILNGTTISSKHGEILGIIGPNGSGKTTLFNLISGFIPIEKGSIYLNDEKLDLLPPYKRARKGIGRVFQNSGIFRDMTVYENILIAIENSLESYSTPHKQLVEQHLDKIGLLQFKNKKCSSLSGG